MVESLFPTSFVALGEPCLRGTVEGQKLPFIGRGVVLLGLEMDDVTVLQMCSCLSTVFSEMTLGLFSIASTAVAGSKGLLLGFRPGDWLYSK